MKMKKLLLTGSILLIFTGCCSSKKDAGLSADQSPAEALQIQDSTARPGEGGGSGAVDGMTDVLVEQN